jgi:hypothetical protein
MKCFYHNADWDGRCSAAIVSFCHSEAELHGVNYPDRVFKEVISPGETVYLVDFSFPIEDMIWLADNTDLHWIDHHQTAIDTWRATGREFPKGIQRSGTAACILTWNYLFPNANLPYTVEMLGRYDVWDLSEDVLSFQFGIGVEKLDLADDEDNWKALFRNAPSITQRIIANGKVIQEYATKQNADYCTATCFDADFEGLHVCVANRARTSSQLFDSLWNPKVYDAMMTFYHTDPDHIKVSLYSTKPEVECGQICKRLGGGGHRGAAGFSFEGNIRDLLVSKPLSKPLEKPVEFSQVTRDPHWIPVIILGIFLTIALIQIILK